MVWGDPFLQSSWEMTYDFSKQWAWLVEGCSELF